MNKKKVNLIIAISNFITMILIAVLYYLLININFHLAVSGKTIFGSKVLDAIINKQDLIIYGAGIISVCINIIGAIQNKENKKICFWQVFFGVFQFIILDIFYELDVAKYILLSAVPIAWGIVTILSSRKNASKISEVIEISIGVASIILAIISSVLDIWYYWGIIAIIAQIFYSIIQNDNIIETRRRKILNIVIHYVLRGIIIASLIVITIISVILANTNKAKWKNGIDKLYVDMQDLKKYNSKDIIIPVENDSKYGFINVDGKEVIPCIYDEVSYFNKIESKNNQDIYYIALAKKDDKYYILSKANDILEIDENIKDYVSNLNYILKRHRRTSSSINFMENDTSDVEYDEDIIKTIFEPYAVSIDKEEFSEKDERTCLNLKVKDSKLTYKNNKFSMSIEPLEDNAEIENENGESLNIYGTKCDVTVTKSNGKVGKETVYLIGLLESENEIMAYSNGSIGFITKDGSRTGWYDENGDKKTLPSSYYVLDIIENNIFLSKKADAKNDSTQYFIINTSGETLLKTNLLRIHGDDMNLIRNDKNKVVFVNKKLEEISKEYDKIFTKQYTEDNY